MRRMIYVLTSSSPARITAAFSATSSILEKSSVTYRRTGSKTGLGKIQTADENMEAPPQKNIKQNIFLFIIGFIGVLSSLPLIPKLLALQPETPPLPIYVLQLLSVVQSSALLFGMVLLGSFFAPQVKLTAPTILAIAKSETALDKIKSQIYPAIIGGVLGGLFLLVFFDFFSNAASFFSFANVALFDFFSCASCFFDFFVNFLFFSTS